jgi:hypothetical protein
MCYLEKGFRVEGTDGQFSEARCEKTYRKFEERLEKQSKQQPAAFEAWMEWIYNQVKSVSMYSLFY